MEPKSPTKPKVSSGPLKRSGAIREPTNPLTRRKTLDSITSSLSSSRAAEHQNTEDMGTGGTEPRYPPDRDKLEQRETRDSNSTSHSDQSWVICHCHTSPNHTLRDWRDDLIWDLSGVQALRDLLRMWIHLGVTASHIGEFLADVLHKRDDHLNGRITHMVDTHQPYMIIGLYLLKHYQTRDDDGVPLWRLNRVKLGDPHARSGNPIKPTHEPQPTHGQEKNLPDTPQNKVTDTRNTWYFIPAPKPFRPFEQAVFLNGTESWRFVETPPPDTGTPKRTCQSFGVGHQVRKLSIRERRALMKTTGDIPHASSAEIIENENDLQRDLIPAPLFTNQNSQKRRKHFGIAQFTPSPLSDDGRFLDLKLKT